ncbi:MAG: S-methyl-5'-thioadenosine phosphorylase [Hyphomonadaceae bacterium]
MTHWKFGVIGGSGLYDLEDMENGAWVEIDSPWGAPSDAVRVGSVAGVEVAFLPRHGRGHRLAPHEVNARANIDALKRLGCTDILAVSAVGSLREERPPGTLTAARQYIDRTRQRPASFFGDGVVAHVSMADPVCPRLTQMVVQAGLSAGTEIVDGATYVAVEGPQFSPRAESLMFRQWGGDIIGMTSMPEARLAREAELPYANLCMVTDYDCWRSADASVDVPEVLRIMRENTVKAKALIVELARTAAATTRTASPIDTCLDVAIVSAPEHWSAQARVRLSAVAGRRLGSPPG